MTRWPTRSRTGLGYGEALQVALGGHMWMTPAERAGFAARWRQARGRLQAAHPCCADLWATLDEVFS